MPNDLRAKTIRLAASFPKRSSERVALLRVLAVSIHGIDIMRDNDIDFIKQKLKTLIKQRLKTLRKTDAEESELLSDALASARRNIIKRIDANIEQRREKLRYAEDDIREFDAATWRQELGKWNFMLYHQPNGPQDAATHLKNLRAVAETLPQVIRDWEELRASATSDEYEDVMELIYKFKKMHESGRKSRL